MKLLIMVTIIIVNENTKDALELCLLSIRKYTEYPFELIVVDNSSQDGSVDLLKKVNGVKVINISGLGIEDRHGNALNIGVQYVRTEYFLILDSDIEILDYNWLTELVAKIKDSQGVFLGEIAPATINKICGNYRERCLPHCLLVNTKFFKKNDCSFTPHYAPLGSDQWQDEPGVDVLFKARKKVLPYCLIEQKIKDKFIHYGSITLATLFQTSEWERYYLRNSQFNNMEKEDFENFIERTIKMKDEKIDLIKTRIKLLKNESVVNINDSLNKRYNYINETLNDLSKKLFRIGEDYFNLGNYELCIRKLQEAILYANSEFKYHIMIKLALSFSKNNMLAEAERLLNNLLALNPKKVEVLYTAGSIYKECNKFDCAIKYFTEVINSNTTYKDKFWAGAYFHLGEIFSKLGKTSFAIDHFKSCLRFNPGHNKALTYLNKYTV